ncbi:TadE/TadG family type IV pilus assembly protein [Actinomyces slackii]|uniref:Flp pilus assembly protein TadG n=1 Tax=Actinomyces slackii TaxID=52774 RepID=A0A448KCH1_9ACTO|nr:pilus assembly protein TadG-related protein [Actinomyces slackii]VEG74580.1 Flp pilus assembly protein TadG [Actinomyces slackii]
MMTRSPRHAGRGGERGSVSVFTVIIAATLMLVAGLCIEGGRVLNARATMTDHAEQAARAGAQNLADSGLRGTAAITLDAPAASASARAYLDGVGHTGDSRVTVSSQTVSVTVEDEVPTTMLRLVGMSSVHVTATGKARAAVGIFEEDKP